VIQSDDQDNDKTHNFIVQEAILLTTSLSVPTQ